MTIDREIRREIAIERSPRVRQLEGLFDLPPEGKSSRVWRHTLALPEEWNIGAIVGPSGCGKTTLARELFGDCIVERWDWPGQKSIVDGFPESMGIRDVTALLCSVGFSSPPAWVRPFAALSNGEQFRVNLARTLAEMPGLAVVDEFSSVVDRTAARIGAAAAAKAVRGRGQRFIAVTCHYDVLDWLAPDWVYEPHTGRFSTSGERGLLWRRPGIELQIGRVGADAWRLFAPHHYLSASLHPGSQCYAALARIGQETEQKPAAFVAALAFPHPSRPGWREHRCVCLPEFQGVGIGNAMSEAVAELYVARGKPYRSTTSHPAMIRHRAGSRLWRMIRAPSLGQRHRGMGGRAGSAGRLTASFEYVGSGAE